MHAGVSCGFLDEPDNGMILYQDGNTLFGQRARYECESGYNLDGTPERTCQADRQWSLTAPTCQRKSLISLLKNSAN